MKGTLQPNISYGLNAYISIPGAALLAYIMVPAHKDKMWTFSLAKQNFLQDH